MNQLRTAATPPAFNCWKVIDDTGDAAGEYEEDAKYFQVESDAYEAYDKILADNGEARLYAGFDDGQEAPEWDLQEFTAEDLADYDDYDGQGGPEDCAPPVQAACCVCRAVGGYLHASGACAACHPILAY